ncbi:Intraflagellar transport protein 122 like [Pseudolycoriella hygida]|uniref:Intraflagellar transport protein 122 homolog n=1 Tax=Pseudolycoriella hygida TaxID=35572 RepID=A0A9Q0N4H4_9DIPT|nr:Intraflagellar transport protein 122 like [Pseudolycoriella hygida]
MRAIPNWIDRISEQTDSHEPTSIQSLCYSPDGNQLLVATGNRVLIYEPSEGVLLDALGAHKDTVYCVAYAKDGKKFATGGADKSVIVWTNIKDGLLKYTHNDSVLCLAFNPVSHALASCSTNDLAFWAADQKAIQKHKLGIKITCCAWTNDGQYIALGLQSGSVSIRNKAGDERGRIERLGASPISSVAWNPLNTTSDSSDMLCIIDWGQTMSFFSLGGHMIGKERSLGFDPLALGYSPDGEFITVAGCNKSIQLFTKDGIRLGMLGELHESWIWTTAISPSGGSIVMGCQDGTLASYNLTFSTVHALYRERYAFRENMCDVIIQHLVSGQKVRIKCRDLVHKVAIYRNRLAVQLPERVVLYELNSGEHQPMHYKVKEKISKKFDCSLLVVCGMNLVLCQEKKLQSLDFTGTLQREWIMDSYIRYIKVTGGPQGKEGLLLGLKNGQVWRIFLDNPLPILVTTVLSSVRCLDINAMRNKLAVVDDSGRLVVRDLLNDTMLYQDSGVNSVAWNTQLQSMICYSHTVGGLSVRVGTLPPRSPQNMTGVVVGVCGATAFCLRGNEMHNVPLALGSTMWQFVESGLFEDAYQVACLGVPINDWEDLAVAAVDALQLQVAKDAYVKVRNLPWLELINDLRERQKRGDVPKEVLQADSLAFAGKFKEAARLYQKSGYSSKALAMYSDLMMFDLAQEFLRDGDANDRKDLVRRRAEWACSVHEPRAAAELLLSAGENERAIEIVAEQGWSDVLYDIGRRLSQSDKNALELVASNLRRLKALPLAAEIYRKLGEESQVVQLHVEARDWTEAFRLAEYLPQVLPSVHLQHAQWLADSDQFLAAQEAYLFAGKPNEARKLLKNLAECAICEERFLDASYYTWLRARQYLQLEENSSMNSTEPSLNYTSLHQLSTIYYAYSTVHSYLKEPFTSSPPLTLFNTSRYVANQINVDSGMPPKGISMFAVLYTLSKQAKVLSANKLYLQVNNRLQSLKAPAGIQEQVDVNFISSKACPGGFNDPEELLPLCYKCSNYSSHLRGNRCPSCQSDYMFSFVSFEILPIVEFYPESGISDTEVERLLMAPPRSNMGHSDPFADTMIHEDITDALPLTLDRDALRAVDPIAVLIVKWPKPLKTKYYRNLLPDLQISICPECLQAFHSEDFEMQVLIKGHCPFCRTPSDNLFQN